MTYDSIKEGMELEYEDFWHSGILTWKKGIVEIIDYGATRIKGVKFDNRERRRIFPHRMHRVRFVTNQDPQQELIKIEMKRIGKFLCGIGFHWWKYDSYRECKRCKKTQALMMNHNGFHYWDDCI